MSTRLGFYYVIWRTCMQVIAVCVIAFLTFVLKSMLHGQNVRLGTGGRCSLLLDNLGRFYAKHFLQKAFCCDYFFAHN
jgi:hypothetical protein